jgi:hypothetical protein
MELGPCTHPSLLRAFQRCQEHNLKHPSSVDLITTKQNKLPSFIDRYKERGENISTNAQYVALHWKSWMRFISESTSGTGVGWFSVFIENHWVQFSVALIRTISNL